MDNNLTKEDIEIVKSYCDFFSDYDVSMCYGDSTTKILQFIDKVEEYIEERDKLKCQCPRCSDHETTGLGEEDWVSDR